MKDIKKKVAALAAVANYIKTQEETAAIAAPQAMESCGPAKEDSFYPPLSMNLWGLSGRQQLMQTRSMMQLKAFHRSKNI